MKLMQWLKAVFNFLKKAFEKMIHELLEQGEIIEFMAEAGSIVREEVLEADELDLPGKEKYKVAFKSIEDRLKAEGKEFAIWLVNWGIENVVASLRTQINV